MVINRDDLLFNGLVVSFSLAAVVSWSLVVTRPKIQAKPPVNNVAVRIISGGVVLPKGTTERQAVKVDTALPPKPKKRPPKPPKVTPPVDAPAAEDSSSSDSVEPAVIQSTQTLAVPAMFNSAPVPDAGSASQVAAMPQPPTTPPPGPDTDSDAPVNPFPVKPYGDTVVVAFKLDSDGRILDSRILVPSMNTLGDMSIRLAAQSNEAKSIRYTNINPPLQPGETKWIVIPHSWDATAGANMLP